MRTFMMVVLATAVAGIAVPNAVMAAPACKDAKGKFIKCPPVVAAKPVVVTKTTTVVKPAPMAKAPAPMAKPMVMSSGQTKDKNGRCHYAAGPKKGQFVKCA